MRDPTFLRGGRLTSSAPLIMVIAVAYGVPFFGLAARISAGPAWINSLDFGYDIEATAVNDAAFDGFSASGARFSGSSGSPLIPAWTRNHLSLTQRRLMNTRRMALILAGLAICTNLHLRRFLPTPKSTKFSRSGLVRKTTGAAS